MPRSNAYVMLISVQFTKFIHLVSQPSQLQNHLNITTTYLRHSPIDHGWSQYTLWSIKRSGSAIFSDFSDGDVQKHIVKSLEQLNVFCHRSLISLITRYYLNLEILLWKNCQLLKMAYSKIFCGIIQR